MMIVKVCGIVDYNQYQELKKLKADMIGFNFYPKSKRFIEAPFTDMPDVGSGNTGVFVNSSVNEILDKVKTYNLDYVQLHGAETVEFCQQLSGECKIIKVFGIDDAFDFSITKSYAPYVDLFLFDTKTPLYGGSGRKFQWEKLDEYNGNIKFLLSGGISPEDAEAILRINHKSFAGVDINSGFETSPGYKDIALISSFMNKVKYEESR